MDDDILIDESGNVKFVYSDVLAEVFDGETLSTTRASHVEPAPQWEGQGWLADMQPSGGPVLYDFVEIGRNRWQHIPFKTREAALQAERRWLRENKGL